VWSLPPGDVTVEWSPPLGVPVTDEWFFPAGGAQAAGYSVAPAGLLYSETNGSTVVVSMRGFFSPLSVACPADLL
jgi:hypothetical protein